MRARYVELLEEDVRHVSVEVLAGVDDDFFDVFARLNHAADRRGFDELRAGAKDGEEFQNSNTSTILS